MGEPSILLVEDNDMNRDMLSRRLSKKGYSVLTATNGRDAIDKARDQLPSLILMDMSIPEVDGWVAARTLKAMPETKKIPIIALTAHAMPGDREKTFEAGCDEYEEKPIEFVRLLEKITHLTSP